MPLSHPFAVQLTQQQMAWLDELRRDCLSRSAVMRLVLEEAMRLDQAGRFSLNSRDMP